MFYCETDSGPSVISKFLIFLVILYTHWFPNDTYMHQWTGPSLFQWLVASLAASNYLDQCWFILDWTLTNKIQRNWNQLWRYYLGKYNWKYHLQNVDDIVSVSVCVLFIDKICFQQMQNPQVLHKEAKVSSFGWNFCHWMHWKLLITTSSASSRDNVVWMHPFPFQWWVMSHLDNHAFIQVKYAHVCRFARHLINVRLIVMAWRAW